MTHSPWKQPLLVLAITSLMATSAAAKVSAEKAAEVGLEGTRLTPIGAIRAGNNDGSIPAWTGGISQYPDGYTPGDWYVDPFASDEILFTITAQNYKQYADKLTVGTQALFERYPETMQMHVYPSRRSASFPDWYYEGSIHNAANTEWCGRTTEPTLAERCVDKSTFKPGVFFPVPKTGGEALWSHSFFYWGKSNEANAYGMNVFADGSYADHMKIDRWNLPWAMTAEEFPKDSYFERAGTAIICGSQEDVYPPRTAGQMFGGCGGWDSIDFDAYLYIPGQRRVRKAPEIGFYDSPGTGSDGLRTADQRWGWALTGAEEWYELEDPIRKEYYVPYNSYKLAQPGVTWDNLARPGHMNPEYKRYELHRVWVIEGRTRPQFRHLSPHRLVYADEDSWAATNADMYDAQDDIWRVSELYNLNFYDYKFTQFWGDAHHDLVNGRYACVNSFYNIGIKDGNSPPIYNGDPNWDYQKPSGLRKLGVR